MMAGMKLRVFMSACILLFSSTIQAADHIWSRQGTVFYLILGNEGVGHVKPRLVYSPDRTKWLKLDFRKGPGDGDAIPVVTLVTGSRKTPIPLNKDWAQVEALWSPDSTSFALTGAFNAYTNSTRILRITNGSVQRVPLNSLWQDMAATYPTCKAAKADAVDCRRDASGEGFNYAAVAWSNPSTAVVFSEVPCSSSWGGIMCQVEGYEFDIDTGRIVSRMSAREFKERWQANLAWKLNIPDPPIWKRAR